MSKVLQAQGVFPGGPPDEVVSWERSDLYLGSANAPRATLDDLVARKGIGVYERMMADEQVKAVVYFKRDAILARGWSFKFDEETTLGEEEQQQRINLFNRITCAIDGSFADALSGISSGRFFGYSLTEKVYSQLEYDGKTFVGLRKLLTRSPQSFEFYTDEYGVLQRFTQRISGKEQELDIARFVHYVHGPEWDAYYGRSDLREAYRAWYAKQRASDYWLQYLERFAGGLLVASLGPDSALTSKHPDYASLQNALTNARSLSSMILPKGVTLEVTHPSTTDQFERAVTFFDQAIAKALLVPNLLGVSHTGQTGSYAQSQTQLDAFLWTLIADSQRLEACLNEQLFRDLGEQNWGDGEYPEFCFKPMSQEQLRWLVSTWGTLTGQAVVVPTSKDEAHLRELLQMPPRDPEDPTLAEENAQRNQDNGLNPDGSVKQVQPDDGTDGEVVDPNKPDNKALLARIDALETMLFHTPGGHDHNQKTHAGGVEGLRALKQKSASPVGARAKLTIQSAAQALGARGLKLKPVGFDAKAGEAKYEVIDTDGISVTVTAKELGDFLKGKDGGEFAERGGKTKMSAPLYRALMHIPGGHEHDQKSHGGRGRMTEESEQGKEDLSDRTNMSAQLYRASQRVHFSVIDQRTQSVADRVAPELAALVAKAVKRALGDDANLTSLTDDDVSDIAAWQLNGSDVSKLKDRFTNALNEGWTIGSSMAMNEIERARREAFTADQKKVRFARLADKAAAYFEANGFRMAGNLRDGARSIVQQNLQNAVKGGWTVQQTRANIWDALTSKGFTDRRSVALVEDDAKVTELLDALNTEDEEGAAHYLNTLVRTNTFEAMNEARYNEFTDPELGDFVVAFEYSAILDERTTQICEELNGHVHAAKSEVWDKYRPPNHYNCRSVLIPITAIDQWDGEESDEPNVEPQEGFK